MSSSSSNSTLLELVKLGLCVFSSDSMASSSSPPHLLVFPYPAQGHMLPLLDLTHQLALRGFTITVLVTPKNLVFLKNLLSAHSSIKTLVLPMPSHPDLPSGVENAKDIGNAGNLPLITALRKLSGQIIQWFESYPSPPSAIIADFFLGWTVPLAKQVGVPSIIFYSSAAFFSSVLNYCWRNVKEVLSSPIYKFGEIPESPSFKNEQIPSVVKFYRESVPDLEALREGMLANTCSWGSVFNTFDALEGEYLEFFRTIVGHRRVFGVGPISLIGMVNQSVRGDPDCESGSDILHWLNGCPDGSVLYVCFGSQKLLNGSQMEALALGLERSGTRFVWVVKSGTTRQTEDGYSVIPNGFEERVKGRGFVIRTWAPQLMILSHRAVGRFLSHCGWNSILEAIVAGIAIIGWPMEADQFINVRLLCEYVGAAVMACEGANSVPNSDELAELIRKSIGADAGEKARAMELKEEAMRAVECGGSSWKDLDGLVKELFKLNATH